MTVVWRALVVVLVATLAIPAAAQTLTTDEVERFVDSMPELRDLTEHHNFDPRAYSTTGGQFLDSVVQFIEDRDLTGVFEPAIRSYGFDDRHDWAGIGNKTIGAFVAMQAAEQSPGMLAQLDAMREQLLADPNLTDQQKQQILNRVGVVGQLPGADDPNIPVVAPFADRIEAAMGPPRP